MNQEKYPPISLEEAQKNWENGELTSKIFPSFEEYWAQCQAYNALSPEEREQFNKEVEENVEWLVSLIKSGILR